MAAPCPATLSLSVRDRLSMCKRRMVDDIPSTLNPGRGSWCFGCSTILVTISFFSLAVYVVFMSTRCMLA